MNLHKIDKKILRFAFELNFKPGYAKKKSLLFYLNIDNNKFDKSIERLQKNDLIKISEKQTHHNGLCYELTPEGIVIANKLNKPFWAKIIEHPIYSLCIAFIAYILSYLLDIFKPELKRLIVKLWEFLMSYI